VQDRKHLIEFLEVPGVARQCGESGIMD
jgi:hypothetical protein